MSKVKIISDTHFSQKSICSYRKQFSTVEEHDQYVFDTIMTNLGKRDTLWILGDVCFTVDGFHKYVVPIANYVNKLHIILGNHDLERKEAPNIHLYTHVGYIKNEVSIHSMVSYKGFWLTHAPIHPDELRGKRNIHGHVHNATINDDRYINVCCEAVNYIPKTLEELGVR